MKFYYGDENWGWHKDGKASLKKHAGDVTEVSTIVERDDEGIYYEVRIRVGEMSIHAFEEGEDQLCIWSGRIDFGKEHATVAGGSVFVAAAREQEQVATEAWEKTR
jgi:hypothetical protein